jgi:hypothetical protein
VPFGRARKQFFVTEPSRSSDTEGTEAEGGVSLESSVQSLEVGRLELTALSSELLALRLEAFALAEGWKGTTFELFGMTKGFNGMTAEPFGMTEVDFVMTEWLFVTTEDDFVTSEDDFVTSERLFVTTERDLVTSESHLVMSTLHASGRKCRVVGPGWERGRRGFREVLPTKHTKGHEMPERQSNWKLRNQER